MSSKGQKEQKRAQEGQGDQGNQGNQGDQGDLGGQEGQAKGAPEPSWKPPEAGQTSSAPATSSNKAGQPAESAKNDQNDQNLPSQSTISSQASSTQSMIQSVTNSSTASPDQANTISKGYSKGALAGAIVGSCLCTALLTLLIIYLLSALRRKGEKNHEKKSDRNVPGQQKGDIKLTETHRHLESPPLPQELKDLPATPIPLTHNSEREKSHMDSYIPHPAEDQDVRSRVLTVIDQIALHVENYYSQNSFSNTETSLSAGIAAMISSYDSPFLPLPMISLLAHRPARIPAIKHSLVRSIFSAILPVPPTSQTDEVSFLPQPYTVYRNLSKTGSDPGRSYINYSDPV